MKSKHEIPNKADFMKAHSFNFLENEKINSHFRGENVAKVAGETDKYGQTTTKPSISSSSTAHFTTQTELENSSRTSNGTEKAETSIVTDSKTDYSGRAPKRYTTKCYIKPVTLPIWYTESLYLHIGSTRRKHEEKIYFKNKMVPYRWSENMYTEVKIVPKMLVSDIHIPIKESEIHYMSLEPQQIAAGAN